MNSEEIKLKKEHDKMISKIIVFFSVIFLIILGGCITFASNLFITPDTAKHIFLDCFNTGQQYYPLETMQDYGNGYVVICMLEEDINQSMMKLKLSYTKLGKKFENKKLDKLDVIIKDPYSQKQILTSSMWIKDLKNTDWVAIRTYEDFIKAADIKLKD